MRFPFVVLILLAFAATPKAQETDGAKARTVLILDCSGSMAAQLEGRSRIVIAREAVRELISGLNPNIELGFMAYGHRRKNDCKDIELLISPDQSDPAKVLELLPKLQPVGMTPLCASVEQAADVLQVTEKNTSVILISDGEETCGGDPAALGKMLHAKGVDFKVHVIGFGLKGAQETALRSLAQETGGKYYSAADAATLKSSLNSAMSEVAKPLPVATPVPVPTPTPSPIEAPGIRARAFEKEGGTAISKGLRWDLKRPGTEDKEGERVETTYDAAPTFKVPPGQYVVSVQQGEAIVSQYVELGESGVRVDLIIGAGHLKLTPVMSAGGPPIEKDVKWEVFTVAEEPQDRKKLSTTYDPIGEFDLPAGSYVIALTRGEATIESVLTVTPAQTDKHTIVLDAGLLIPTPYMVEGGPVIDKETTWEIMSAENAEGERKKLATNYDLAPRFSLRTGEYLLRLSRGLAKKDTPVTIKAGESLKVNVVLNAGILHCKAPAGCEKVTWEILQGAKDNDGIAELRRLGTEYDLDLRWVLPAGDYTLRRYISDKPADLPVTIQAGKVTEPVIQP